MCEIDLFLATYIAGATAPKLDFASRKESDNARGLLVKLGVTNELLELPRASAMNSTDESKESFKKIICRYLGAHANVQAKVSLAEGLEALDIAVKGTEGAFGAES